MTQLLIDGDMIAYRLCIAAETDIRWDDGFHTLHSDSLAVKHTMMCALEELLKLTAASDMVIFFSSNENFRKDVYPGYKSNREGKRKPLAYLSIVDWCFSERESTWHPGLEADDLMGMEQTEDTIIVSGDKDMIQIAGRHFNHLKPHLGVITVTQEEADRFFLVQCLAGDKVDGYSGCPGVGPKTAEKLFARDGWTWSTVLEAYAKQDLDEDFALSQARCARILRRGEYDWLADEVKLWSPEMLEVTG